MLEEPYPRPTKEELEAIRQHEHGSYGVNLPSWYYNFDEKHLSDAEISAIYLEECFVEQYYARKKGITIYGFPREKCPNPQTVLRFVENDNIRYTFDTPTI